MADASLTIFFIVLVSLIAYSTTSALATWLAALVSSPLLSSTGGRVVTTIIFITIFSFCAAFSASFWLAVALSTSILVMAWQFTIPHNSQEANHSPIAPNLASTSRDSIQESTWSFAKIEPPSNHVQSEASSISGAVSLSLSPSSVLENLAPAGSKFTPQRAVQDGTESFTNYKPPIHHVQSEAPSTPRAVSVSSSTSSVLDNLSTIRSEYIADVGGETEVSYWSSQQLTVMLLSGLLVTLVLFWCQNSRWGIRRSLARAYRYRPLNVEKNEIRLLHILPSIDKDDVVSCNLRHASFAENPAYVALSYHWGDSSERRYIRLNGVKVSVTVNLEEALRHMRSRWQSLDVWVDALCIDQQNMVERGAQVLRMFGIYQRARVVAIWLGSEENGSGRVMNALSKSQGIERPVDYGDRFLNPLADYEQSPSPEDWYAFFRRPYWRRVWIIQEIAASNQVCLLCGDWTVPLNDIDKFTSDLAKVKPGGVEDSAALIDFIFELCSGRRDLEVNPLRLLEALQRTQSAISSEIIDKVYGIIGLVSDRTTFIAEPSYGISKRRLCMIMTEGAIYRKRSLDFIFLGKGHVPAAEMPSWCADYTASASESLDPVMVKYLLGQDVRYRLGVKGNRWNTTGNSRISSLMAVVDHAEGVLRFRGVRIGTVTSRKGVENHISEHSRSRLLLMTRTTDDLIRDCLAQILLIYGDFVEVTRVLVDQVSRRLSRFPESPMVYAWFNTNSGFDVHGCALASRLYDLQDVEDVDAALSEQERNQTQGLRAAVLSALESIIEEHLSLITLAVPQVGWAHRDTDFGDQVFIAQGCSLPMVLRPVAGHANRFTLVGRAYVSNAMNNEHENLLKESAQSIEIC